jgi:hypothetical protein
MLDACSPADDVCAFCDETCARKSPANARLLLFECEPFLCEVMRVGQIHLWLALGVVVSTAATDAVYVMFSAAVASRRRLPAATWSSVWYLLSAFAVISYTRNWVYVCFAAIGSWIGAYLSMTFLRRGSGNDEQGRATPDS